MMENSAQRIAEKIVQCSAMDGQVVLEVGCGDGRITSLLAGLPTKIIAIEPDEKQIKTAAQNVAGVDFQVGSGESLHFPENYFDTILFTLSLHHQNSRVALAEAERVLKDDGTILVIEPSEEGEIEQLFGLVHDEVKAKQAAQTAIKKSGLILDYFESFTAHWMFDSREELCRTIFEYYNMPYNEATALSVSDLLQKMRKADTTPIKLVDTMTIQSLKVTTHGVSDLA